MRAHQVWRINGFTLIEMVTVILILAIIVVGVSSFIIFGTRIFIESSSVDQVLSQSRYGVERMTRDIRSAVPNSARINTASNGAFQCVEVLPIAASSTYLSAPIAPDSASNNASVIASNHSIVAGNWAIVYPLTTTEIYNATGTTAKRFQISSANIINNQLDIVFTASVRFTEASPLNRMFFSEQPISYCFEKNTNGETALYRYSNYGFNAIQPVPSSMSNRVLMAQNVANDLLSEPALALTPSSLITNAIIHIEPRFSVNGETFKYQHQVQVVNVP
ncbi:PilW family protein [Shewanella gaetbuli]|uniref:Prepilin-type N-terminal cleavage/methylation domain-containing protein n=1 Tax=Shewanella gaetbuli TaxID=220752 RepID=A0A9X1ZLW7_9GAMM|nr:prepilin-type N-terminal cleavage/methylation domain-containing protein [Shewanella gaetbuli]MCL1142102.1 prepilin-type N-terminal cleavage/methylation domain-containing protein [Shewanella gaetbuli]